MSVWDGPQYSSHKVWLCTRFTRWFCFHIWTRLAMTLELYKFLFNYQNLCNSHQLLLTQNIFKLNMFQVITCSKIRVNAWRCVACIFHFDVQILRTIVCNLFKSFIETYYLPWATEQSSIRDIPMFPPSVGVLQIGIRAMVIGN